MTAAVIVLGGLALALAVLWIRAAQTAKALRTRFGPIVDIEAERVKLEKQSADLRADVVRLEQERNKSRGEWENEREAAMTALQQTQREESQKFEREKAEKRSRWEREFEAAVGELKRLTREVELLEEKAELQSFGHYKPHFDLATSAEYQARLDAIVARQEQMLKSKEAAVCGQEWVIEGNRAKGRQFTERNLKLMLRAFNGEADAVIARVTYKNVATMEERLRRSFDAINKLGEPVTCRIVERYLDLRLDELRLTYELAEKVQAEKEEQRRIKEEMKEEEQAQREIEKAQREAEADEAKFAKALEKAKNDLDQASAKEQEKLNAKIADLERKLSEAHANKEKALSMAQLTKSGHVYVISNEGSFGPDVFKVGMTRRLVPQERVDELGDASVPFRFDVHAMIYSENAPELEHKLHLALAEHQVNLVNARREFFRVDIDVIREVVTRLHSRASFTLHAEAAEYRKSEALRVERAAAARHASIPPAPVAEARERFADLRRHLENA